MRVLRAAAPRSGRVALSGEYPVLYRVSLRATNRLVSILYTHSRQVPPRLRRKELWCSPRESGQLMPSKPERGAGSLGESSKTV